GRTRLVIPYQNDDTIVPLQDIYEINSTIKYNQGDIKYYNYHHTGIVGNNANNVRKYVKEVLK
ncbi:MAG: hypothetical protein AABY14_03460, partial [Nanoarchaeota archaeon]